MPQQMGTPLYGAPLCKIAYWSSPTRDGCAKRTLCKHDNQQGPYHGSKIQSPMLLFVYSCMLQFTMKEDICTYEGREMLSGTLMPMLEVHFGSGTVNREWGPKAPAADC